LGSESTFAGRKEEEEKKVKKGGELWG